MDQLGWQEVIMYAENPLRDRNTLHEERSTTMFFKGSRTGLNELDRQTDEARDGVYLGTILIVMTFNEEFKSTFREEGPFFTPLKYIDVVRRTNTTQDVLLEGSIGDFWNADGGGELSGPWNHFRPVHKIERIASQWFHVVQGGDQQKFR